MRDWQLLPSGQLTESLVQGKIKEERIVSEPTQAAGRFKNDAVDAALCRGHHLIMTRDRQDTDIVCGSSVRRNAPQRGKEPLVVRLIAGFRAREPCRPYSRRAVQRIDTDARIVGKYQAFTIRAVVDRLFDGILHEGGAIFDAGGQIADRGEGLDHDAEARGGGLQFS